MKFISLLLVLSLLPGIASCSPSDEGIQAEIPENSGNNNNGNEGMKLQITVGTTAFAATLANNPAANAFKELLPLTLHMNDFNSNEKVTSLPESLPTNTYRPGTIRTGDIMLYGSSSLVIFYETFSSSYSYSAIGTFDNPSGLKSALGAGSVRVTFDLAEAE